MRERLLNEIILALREEYRTTRSLEGYKNRISLILSNYEVTARCTEIIEYDYIPESLETYLVTRVVEGMARSTAKQYRKILVIFFMSIRKPLPDIDSNDIRTWLYCYQKYNDCGNRYLNWIRIILNTYFMWLVNNDYLTRNPAANIKSIRYVEARRDSLTQEELEEIRDKCSSVRDRLVVEILYSTGMRLNELCNAKMKDLDLNNRTFVIYNQKGKRYKTCYLNDKSIYWIKKYLPLRFDNEYFIQGMRKPHTKISGRTLEKIIYQIVDRTSITKKVSPSTLRHTCATQGLNNGMSLVEVQSMLDHRSPDSTLIYADRYTDNIQHSHRKAII